MKKFEGGKDCFPKGIPIHVQHMGFKYESIHMHDFFEFVYMLKGELHNKINGESFLMRAGCMAFMNSEQTHEIYACTEEVAYINILVSKDFIKSSSIGFEGILSLFSFVSVQGASDEQGAVSPVVCFEGEQKDRMETLVHTMLEEYNAERPYYDKILSHYFNVLLLELVRCFDSQEKREVVGEIDSKLTRVLEYIEENSAEKINLKDIACKFFYNSSYFSRMFKKVLGITFKDYLQNVRVKKAIKMLNETDYSVNEISLMVGYEDKKQFYNVFKKITNSTPGKYKREKLSK